MVVRKVFDLKCLRLEYLGRDLDDVLTLDNFGFNRRFFFNLIENRIFL